MMSKAFPTAVLVLVFGAPPLLAENPPHQRWDARYAGETYVFGKEASRLLRHTIDMLGDGEALVLAMGEGRNAVFLAEQGFAVTGVDVSAVGVAKAERLAAERGVEIEGVVADLGVYDLGRERWDLVTNFYYLDRALFPRIVAALKPGGMLVLETFSTDHPGLDPGFGPRSPEHLLRPNEVFDALSDLRVLYYEDRVLDLDEGMHKGKGAIIRLIAQKPR